MFCQNPNRTLTLESSPTINEALEINLEEE